MGTTQEGIEIRIPQIPSWVEIPWNNTASMASIRVKMSKRKALRKNGCIFLHAKILTCNGLQFTQTIPHSKNSLKFQTDDDFSSDFPQLPNSLNSAEFLSLDSWWFLMILDDLWPQQFRSHQCHQCACNFQPSGFIHRRLRCRRSIAKTSTGGRWWWESPHWKRKAQRPAFWRDINGKIWVKNGYIPF